jgi:hypothetical protein
MHRHTSITHCLLTDAAVDATDAIDVGATDGARVDVGVTVGASDGAYVGADVVGVATTAARVGVDVGTAEGVSIVDDTVVCMFSHSMQHVFSPRAKRM